MDEVAKRMAELAAPIEHQILMCDNREELLMLAVVILQRTREIFDLELTVVGRNRLFVELV